MTFKLTPEARGWMFEACDEKQIERYIRPIIHGRRHECYAITEAESGSDVAGISATAERFFRELRAERIWEGTSEIQRLIIARGLAKRGREALIGMAPGE